MAAEGVGGCRAGQEQSHALRRKLGLRDLVPMQILLVVGITWAGTAAKQGGTHIWFWLAAILTMFVPLAAVVGWCARVWPLEGGVYQWTKFALGPFAGFMSAWNFGLWALLAVSNVGIMTATSLSYGLGQRAAWMEENHTLILGLTVGSVPGDPAGEPAGVRDRAMGVALWHPGDGDGDGAADGAAVLPSPCQRAASACEPAEAVQPGDAGADSVQREHPDQDCVQRADRAGAGGGVCGRDAGRWADDHAVGMDCGPGDCSDLHPDVGRDAGVHSGGEGGPDGADPAGAGGGVRRRGGGAAAWTGGWRWDGRRSWRWAWRWWRSTR